ncbi:hypothetical protein C1645_865029 [Glomus cerebriforme]|uniref:Uncharacterized protein n=1 Tax=Glomus cerebriforme TaxID=658196 RepID=A0A397S4P0_9GLOM|nr:hypothetical protein C1645_865029 [Glomus cerebriforme]
MEDEDITISNTHKRSTSTSVTNDMEEQIEIANTESSYVIPNNNQQPNQEEEHMEIEYPSLTEEVRIPDKSSTKKKSKNKSFTPHIITGHTVLPKLNPNIHDIMLYDIPGNWDAEQITEAINKHLGSLLKATLKKQGFFENQVNVMHACQKPITLHNVKYKWTHDNYRQEKERS